MTNNDSTEPKPRRHFNWWKMGFFVMLILFELAREFAVVGSDEGAQPNGSKVIYATGDYVVAQGRWLRSDGGSPIVPSTVTIECERNRGQCVEVSVTAIGKHFFAPTLDWFDATFTPQGVSYENDNPACARYSVQIDTVQKRAYATRNREAHPKNANCEKMEERVAMELGDGYLPDQDPLKGHFVPFFQLLAAIF